MGTKRRRIRLKEESSFPKDNDSYSTSSKSVDTAINILALLHCITGLLFVPYIWTIFFEISYSGPSFFIYFAYFIGGLLLTSLPIYFILGLAIWNTRPWAWKTSVLVNAICFILTTFGQIIFPAMLNIVLLLMLNNTDVKTELRPEDYYNR